MTFLASRFRRDIALLLIVSVLVGALLSSAISLTVESCFGDALSGLIGDYGEYDIVVGARQDMAKATRDVLNEIAQTRLGGAGVKQGLTVAGKANLFISLPEAYRRKDILEGIGTTLSGLPGYTGYSIIMEPRISIRGLAPGSLAFFESKFESIDGVSFAFPNEGGLDVLLELEQDSAGVHKRIRGILSDYKIIEARFPIGFRVHNAAQASAKVIRRVRDEMSARVVIDVSNGETDEEMLHFIESLSQMRRFLLSYATKVHLPGGSSDLVPGDFLLLRSKTDRNIGVSRSDIIAKVMYTAGEDATAIVVRGDANEIAGGDVVARHILPSSVTTPKASRNTTPERWIEGEEIGQAKIISQRKDLLDAITNSIRLLMELEAAALDADKTLADLSRILLRYEEVLSSVSRVSDTLDVGKASVELSVTQLEELRGSGLRESLNETVKVIDLINAQIGRAKGSELELAALFKSAKAARISAEAISPKNATFIGKLTDLEGRIRTRYEEAKSFSASAGTLSGQLNVLRQRIPSLLLDFAHLDSVLAQRLDIRRTLEHTLTGVQDALSSLKSVDIVSIRDDVEAAAQRVDALQAIDIGAIKSQLEHIQASLPQLSDEDVGQSVTLIDRYLQGQVIPGERIALLTDAAVPDRFVGDAAGQAVSIDKVYLISSSAGAIQPNLRGEVSRLIKEMRAVVSALVAIVFTMFALAFDHATLISFAKVRARYKMGSVPAIAPVYCALTGAVLVTAICLLSQARIPQLGIWPLTVLAAVVGWLVALGSERISPVAVDEVMGAESVGMSASDVLRQVVIPATRPGLLYLLNRRRVLL